MSEPDAELVAAIRRIGPFHQSQVEALAALVRSQIDAATAELQECPFRFEAGCLTDAHMFAPMRRRTQGSILR